MTDETSFTTEETLDINIAKKYISTMIEPTCLALRQTLTPKQSLKAEAYIEDYLERCLRKGYVNLTAEALAKFVIAGVLKTLMMEEMSKTETNL